MKPKVYHAHIPKTAGTALNSWLNDSASSERVKPDEFDGELSRWLRVKGFPEGRSADAVADVCWNIYDVLHGHRNIIQGRTADSTILTTLRDPVARSISLFFDFASIKEEVLATLYYVSSQNLEYRRDCTRLTFTELRKKWSENRVFLGQHQDFMCRYLTNHKIRRAEEFFQLTPLERFQRALQVLDQEIDAIGVTEDMDKSILYFSEVLCRYPVRSLPRYNPGRPKTSEITPADRAYLDSITVGDQLLWKHYKRRFDSLDVNYSVEIFESKNLGKALQAIEMRRVNGKWAYDMNMALVGDGFWGRDSAGTKACRRWSGPLQDSVLYLPTLVDGPIDITLYVQGWQGRESRSSFGVRVWGTPVEHEFNSGPCVDDLVTFRARPRQGVIKLNFYAETRTDEECGKSESDGRRKGFSLKCITMPET